MKPPAPSPHELRAQLAALHDDCYGWALACCRRDRDQAEEALQRAYLRILEGRARFRGTSSLRTFVFGVIRMTAREEQRGFRRFISAERSLDGLADSARLADAAASAEDRRVRLLRALDRLSARQRQTLQLVFYHDMTIEDAAAAMGVRIGSARTHYERGKARLRLLLKEEFGDD